MANIGPTVPLGAADCRSSVPLETWFRPDSGGLSLRQYIQELIEAFEAREGVISGGGLERGERGKRPWTVPLEGMTFERYVAEFLPDIIDGSINTRSTRCLAHMAGAIVNFSGIVAEVATRLNQNMVKQDASGALAFIERDVLAMLHKTTFRADDGIYEGYHMSDHGALGMLTSGGTLANLAGLWCARSAAVEGVHEDGLVSALKVLECERLVILASRLAHYSIERSAIVLGLGRRAVLSVPVDARGRMRIDALEETLRECRARRWKVMAVVGTAGTTDCGSIDPLHLIADIAEREGVPFHVDAAWGAGLLFSDTHRDLVRGIERADTVAVDGHKQLYVPLAVSALLFRSPAQAMLIQQSADYMLRRGSGDLGRFALQGSRAADSLSLHAALHVVGVRGFGAIIERMVSLARAFANHIDSRCEFELLAPPDTNIVLYRYIPVALRRRASTLQLTTQEQEAVNRFNVDLHQLQYRRGRSLVSRTTWRQALARRGVPLVALRAIVGNPRTTDQDLAEVLDDQCRLAEELTAIGT